jgi:hypothetical protein
MRPAGATLAACGILHSRERSKECRRLGRQNAQRPQRSGLDVQEGVSSLQHQRQENPEEQHREAGRIRRIALRLDGRRKTRTGSHFAESWTERRRPRRLSFATKMDGQGDTDNSKLSPSVAPCCRIRLLDLCPILKIFLKHRWYR